MKHLLLGLGLAIFNPLTFSSEKSICGEEDDRVLSYENEIGRASKLSGTYGCTATMISDKCAISAGHCVGALSKVSFNVPESIETKPQPANPRDIYYLNKETLVWQENGEGDDWAVFELKKNPITGKYPGEVQGHLSVNLNISKVRGKTIRISGYGKDGQDSIRNFAQQTHTGKVKKLGGWASSKSRIAYTVDTMGGNSGSSLILQSTNEIIGIHTHGGCGTWGNTNAGTLISRNQKLKQAIKACLNRN